MAAITPTVTRECFGSKTVLKAAFTDIDDTDTWASGIKGKIWGWQFQRTDNPTAQASVDVAVAESSGTFTFYPAEDAAVGSLYVYIDD